MSTQTHQTEQTTSISEQARRQRIVSVVWLHMGRRGWHRLSDLLDAIQAVDPSVTKTRLYSRMAGETDWVSRELEALATVFKVSVGALFEDPEQMTAGQNWKAMMTPDLRVYEGGHKVNGARAMLYQPS